MTLESTAAIGCVLLFAAFLAFCVGELILRGAK